MNVLVTGATGFVGRSLIRRLAQDPGMTVRAAVRDVAAALPSHVERVVWDLTHASTAPHAVSGATTVVHLAARVHVMRETCADPMAEFRRINVDGTLSLARTAAAAGARRFVFLSSVKVNGESGTYRESDTPAPEDPYAVSKEEAEAGLREIATRTGMEVVIIRAPLVYGPGVGANFGALVRAVSRGVPLPLGAIHNRRSLVGVDNLADFIITCMEHPAAANETFLVSDDEDVSTTELIRRVAHAMGRPAHLIPMPAFVLVAAAAALGKQDVIRRLLGTLCVDISKAKQRLGWAPVLSLDEGLTTTVAALG